MQRAAGLQGRSECKKGVRARVRCIFVRMNGLGMGNASEEHSEREPVRKGRALLTYAESARRAGAAKSAELGSTLHPQRLRPRPSAIRLLR